MKYLFIVITLILVACEYNSVTPNSNEIITGSLTDISTEYGYITHYTGDWESCIVMYTPHENSPWMNISNEDVLVSFDPINKEVCIYDAYNNLQSYYLFKIILQ